MFLGDLNKNTWIENINSSTLDQVNRELTTKIVNLDSNKVNVRDFEVEKARIDSFTKLPSGSTTGDAELIDARIGANGYTYSNIGEAIRNQYKSLSEDISYINEGENVMRFTESDLESGNINYSTGDLEEHPTAKRTKDYILLEVGEEITINVKNATWKRIKHCIL